MKKFSLEGLLHIAAQDTFKLHVLHRGWETDAKSINIYIPIKYYTKSFH